MIDPAAAARHRPPHKVAAVEVAWRRRWTRRSARPLPAQLGKLNGDTVTPIGKAQVIQVVPLPGRNY
jgi:hypothetical protein